LLCVFFSLWVLRVVLCVYNPQNSYRQKHTKQSSQPIEKNHTKQSSEPIEKKTTQNNSQNP
jgi:Flp pilus assembly protein TadB